MRQLITAVVVAVLLISALASFAAPDQTYRLVQSVISSGGGRHSNPSYILDGTSGQPVNPSVRSSAQWQLHSGFWGAVAPVKPTPTGPWAIWQWAAQPLQLPPHGTEAVIVYGNLTPPVPITATLTGPALFEDGTTQWTTALEAPAGTVVLRLMPAPEAVPGDAFTLTVWIQDIELTKEGRILGAIYLPAIIVHR